MKKRYVYYNEFSGQILEILKEKKENNKPCIECDFEEVRSIIIGTKSINDVVVAYDKHNKVHKIIEKDNIIRIRKLGNKLYKIPNKRETFFDLRLILYEKGDV
jgi:hypothetical protein